MMLNPTSKNDWPSHITKCFDQFSDNLAMPASPHAAEFDRESRTCSEASTSVPDWPAGPYLRGLRWRILLGVLPSCPASIGTLRCATANGRRRYAELRRRLIVDPHAVDNFKRGENLVVNNPLSQDPDSVWGHYFKNAELERTIKNDLARLYLEHGSFFQSHACQTMLKRVLLVWALSNPEYGYRQGMHEVLAILAYVLHLDVTHLLEVKQRYEDPFGDRFDTPLKEKISSCMEGKQVMASFTLFEDGEWIHRVHPDDMALVEPDDFGFNLKTMVFGSDSYGAEGELGALLSGRFLEHDAYCMLNALMRGEGGSVALADYFLAVNEGAMGSSSVLDTFTDMYHTLAIVDSPLYTHLVEIGVEPQFFALRWFRVLFGREFDLEMLLHLWDAIFGTSYSASVDQAIRGEGHVSMSSVSVAFLSTFAVSMIIYLRPTLLAVPDATICLQKLLNFPKHVDVRELIENAKVLQMLSEEPSKSPSFIGGKYSHVIERREESKHKNGCASPSVHSRVLQHGTPELRLESYWEEKWMSSVLPENLSTVMSSNVGANHNGSSNNINGGIEGSDLVEDTDAQQIVQFNNILLAEKNSKPIRRSLFATIWQSAAQLMTFEDRKAGASTTLETSPNNPIEASNTEGVSEKGSEGVSSIKTEHNPEKEDHIITGGTGGHGSSEAAISVIWTSDDGETSCSGDDESKSHTSCSTLDQAMDATSDKSLTHPIEEEMGCLRLSNGCGEFCEQLKEGHVRRDEVVLLASLKGEFGGASTFQDTKDDWGTAEITNEKRFKVTLQTLGQSMVESIQMIECALSGLAKEGAPMGYRETAENTSRTFLNGKGHLTALSALTELRKISSLLVQM